MKMTINFDMDGTIADLYGVENWLEKLQAEDATPYAQAKPLVNLNLLARYLNKLLDKGINVNIISWGSKYSSNEYLSKVTKAKMHWLHQHLSTVHFTNIYIVPYGTPKAMFCRCKKDILFDDEEQNREKWKGKAYDVNNILEILKNI